MILSQFGSEFFVVAVSGMHWGIVFLDLKSVEREENANISSHKE